MLERGSFELGMARAEREREGELRANVDICRMFLWTAFCVIIGTSITVLMAPELGISRLEAAGSIIIWMLVPVSLYMIDMMLITPLAERWAGPTERRTS